MIDNKRVFLDELNLSNVLQDEGVAHKNQNGYGGDIVLGGDGYKRGVGTIANSMIYVKLNGNATRFKCVAGIDDCVRSKQGHKVDFQVIADDKIIWSSGPRGNYDLPFEIDLSMEGVDTLLLYGKTIRGKLNGLATWADAYFDVVDEIEGTFLPLADEEPYILTPPPEPRPVLTIPSVYGARPGSPILFKLTAIGDGPFQFEVNALPEGLIFNADNNTLQGMISKTGSYNMTISVSNAHGKSSKELQIKIGSDINLTPPMGWNSWNCWGCDVNENNLKDAANAIVDHDLINYGWNYVNIDDGWQGGRDPDTLRLTANDKFPNMSELTQLIHDKGLKAGIYSTPWKLSYGQLPGGSADTTDGQNLYLTGEYTKEYGVYGFHAHDAQQFADWEFDYLKYDWFPNTISHTAEMDKALNETGRDITLSLSNAAPIEHVEHWQKHSQLWRTTGDIFDNWGSFYAILSDQPQWADHGGPGHWNDADMLIVGTLGWGVEEQRMTRLSPTEQYTHVSMWALLSSPLLLGCDLTKLDDFTLNLLSNHEVIAINQDALGKTARRVWQDNMKEIWIKELENGEYAVGLCNFGLKTTTISLDFSAYGLPSEVNLRDIWTQTELGVAQDSYCNEIKPHGCKLLKLSFDFPV